MNEISALATSDVVVVGGGISGWSTAFELRRRGFHVVVVEQRFTAYGASGRNPGAIWMQLRRRGLELELATAGMRKYQEFLAEYGRTFELRRDGGVLFCETAAQQAAEKFRLKGDWSRFDLRDKKSSDAEGFIFRKTDETKVFSV